jgi:hypothetical protein
VIRNAPHAALMPGARLGSGQLEPEPEPEPSQSGISIGSARPSLARLMKALGSARQADRSANTGSATASSGSGSRRNTSCVAVEAKGARAGRRRATEQEE